MAKWMWDASEKLNYPSAQRLYQHLKNNDQHVPFDIVDKGFVKKQAERHIFYHPREQRRPRRPTGPAKLTPPNLRQGRVPAADIDDRWMADLADLTAQPSVESGVSSSTPFQYILVVLNVFSKQLWVRALRTKTPGAVTDAFQEILHGQTTPSRLDTDAGSEFTGPFVKLLEEKDIWHVIKDTQDANTLSPIDSAIGTLKRAIFRRVVADKDSDWASSLQRTVDGYNQTVHGGLQGRAPDDVPDDPELQFALRRFNSEGMVHNANVIHNRDEKLVKKGAFRIQDPNRTFARSYQPKFGNKVHEVEHAAGGIVLDKEGKVYKSKHTFAVPSGSEDVADVTKGMRGGSALIQRKNLDSLEPYKDRIKTFVSTEGKWEFEVAAYMKALGMTPLFKNGLNFRKALLILGFQVNEKGRVTFPSPMGADVQVQLKRPALTPAEAATALRRRVTGKTSV